MASSRSISESISESKPSMRAPDTYKATGKWWDEAMDHANVVLEHVNSWNQAMGRGNDNQFARQAIMAYTIIKTLPACEPWASFRRTYWNLIKLFIANGSLQDSGVGMEDIDKSLIRWEGTVKEVFQEMELTIAEQEKRKNVIMPNDFYWSDMYERLETREETRVVKQHRNDYARQFRARIPRDSTSQKPSSSDSASFDPEVNCRTCGPDYEPESSAFSSEDSSYAYDPYDLH